MRALVTGGTGFVGGALIRQLRGRGDEVLALVRDRQRAGGLLELGCELVVGELPNVDLTDSLARCDAAFHAGGRYRVGIPASGRADMYRANVQSTEALLTEVERAGTPRVVFVSTVGALGNTHGQVVDETHHRPDRAYVSYYDETKHLAHQAAEGAAARGVPVVIAMPGQVYGPGDHSAIGRLIEQAAAGTLRARAFPEAGVCMVHVDDLADGMLRVHDAGAIGESYVLTETCIRLGALIERVAAISGRKPPRLTVPTGLLRALAPLGFLVGPLTGAGPNLRETIRTGDGATFWASSAKARRELGWLPRDLDTGLRELLNA
jgi:nucleoside-diphosphate-sugar epimerase